MIQITLVGLLAWLLCAVVRRWTAAGNAAVPCRGTGGDRHSDDLRLCALAGLVAVWATLAFRGNAGGSHGRSIAAPARGPRNACGR